jgi:DNA-binding beta-propeller fold protein YncE
VPLFSSSPGQVAFTPGGRELVVTTKSANTVEVFPMTRDGRPARRAVVNDSAGAVPFAITFDKAGRMLVAETKESTVSTYKVRVRRHHRGRPEIPAQRSEHAVLAGACR